MRKRVVNVQDLPAAGSGTAGIQEAVDRLPAEGGTVYLPPGRYALRRSVLLRSNVRVCGEGAATVILRPPPVEGVPVNAPTNGARTSVRVAEPGPLEVGDQIYIRDDENKGWWATHAIVRSLGAGELGLEVLHGEEKYVYTPERHARLANWFPCFWLRELRDVTLERLTIDGGIGTHACTICDFVVAAVHARGCENVRVRDLTVRNWPGDGIGLQGGRGGFVSGCLVENCAGHGYHPGTSLTQSVWADNIARGNTRDGFFFCLRVTHSTVRGNVLVGNAGHGIGGLSDPDQYNAVIGNVCADNGLHGIEAAKSIGNTIQGNVCRNNSRREAGKCAGIFLEGHRLSVVTGNVCVDDQERPTQTQGLVEREPAGANVVQDNVVAP